MSVDSPVYPKMLLPLTTQKSVCCSD